MDRSTPMAAAPAHWVRFLLSSVLALAVLTGGLYLYLARGELSAGAASGRAAVNPRVGAAGCGAAAPCAGNLAGVAMAAPLAVATVPPAPARPRSPRAAATGTPGARPSATAAASSPPADQGGTAAAQVLALINSARAAAGLPALTITTGLQASSSAHTLLMAGGCGLSHQCPGEPPLGGRETAAGVSWTAAAENIGEGGPVAGSAAAIAQMAVGLTQSMLSEQPPDDGHRLNILSSAYTHIGITVYRDGSGTVWLTQDFSN